ncbi:LysR family transcriptional regulator [Amycolatopsis taiwanensis]|uniref:LysR family transcriptional regulator n=1 Tax=Amycolatopsis taiwanensis TaxID=342230 RepID=UPI0004BCBA8A|nr:LysR substrate-binding domain-containing protein [Amycolatopsis taiwanensis]
MELRQLRYFVTVAEELHYGRAARRLHIAQPGLSQQIKIFERQLGVPLFHRNRRGVSLTDAGQVLLPEAKDLLARADAITSLVRRHGSGRQGELLVSLTRSAPNGIVTELLDAFRADHPLVELKVTSGFTGLHEQQLRDRVIDVAFVRPPVDEGADLGCLHLAEEPMVLAVPSGHVLARRRRVRTADVAGQPLVWWPREHGPGMWDRMLDEVFGVGVRPPAARWEPEEERMLHAVQAGHGVTMITQGRAESLRRRGVVFKRFVDPQPTVPIGIAWHLGNTNPALARFLDCARAASLDAMPAAQADQDGSARSV